MGPKITLSSFAGVGGARCLVCCDVHIPAPARVRVTGEEGAEEWAEGVGTGCDEKESGFDGGPDVDISAKPVSRRIQDSNVELGFGLRCYVREVIRDFGLVNIWDADYRTYSGTVV